MNHQAQFITISLVGSIQHLSYTCMTVYQLTYWRDLYIHACKDCHRKPYLHCLSSAYPLLVTLYSLFAVDLCETKIASRLIYNGILLLVGSAHPEVGWVGCPWPALSSSQSVAHLCNSYTNILTFQQSTFIHKPLFCMHIDDHLHKSLHFNPVPSAWESFCCSSSICLSLSSCVSIGYKNLTERKIDDMLIQQIQSILYLKITEFALGN